MSQLQTATVICILFHKVYSLRAQDTSFCMSLQTAISHLQSLRAWATLSILRVGHSDIFDINVPGFFFKIWYQCPNSCPTFLTQILSLYDMKLRITITWIVEFFSYCVYFMWKQYWFHQIHTTKLGLGEAVWEKCFVSHLAQNFDIKCPSWWPQILISSHCSCPTLTVLSVIYKSFCHLVD